MFRGRRPSSITVRTAVLVVFLAVHVFHVLTTTDRFPFHSVSMFRGGTSQADRVPTVSIQTPALLASDECDARLVAIRAQHGLQPRTSIATPGFLLRWDNTATFPLRYDVELAERFAIIQPVAPKIEGTELVVLDVTYHYTSGALTARVAEGRDHVASTTDGGYCTSVALRGWSGP